MGKKILVMVKPDGVKRGLVGEVIMRYERKGFLFVKSQRMNLAIEKIEVHYAHHRGKDFFQEIVNYMTSGPIVAMIFEAPKNIHPQDIYSVARRIAGETNGSGAAPGTIRGDFGVGPMENILHVSESAEAAAAEIANIFSGY